MMKTLILATMLIATGVALMPQAAAVGGCAVTDPLCSTWIACNGSYYRADVVLANPTILLNCVS
jgi:hypothetical protein